MSSVIPFEARRFKSAAQHYLRGRPPYPDQLISDVALLCDLSSQDKVLDLGCGPGQLSLAFAPLVRDVLAIDPEPEMLALCQAQAATMGYRNIAVELGSSNNLDPNRGRFKLVLIGRAFHWMDRVRTLQLLETMLEADGAVILFSDDHPDLPANAWVADFDAMMDRYAATDTGRAIHRSPSWVNHEAILLASSFNRLQRVSVIEQRTLTIDHLIDRALSRSSTTAARLGDQTSAMITEIRHLFAPAGADGCLDEVVETKALIARRRA